MKKRGVLAVFLLVIILSMPISFVQAISIYNVSAQPAIDSAKISWTTDLPSQSLINYGNTRTLGITSENQELALDHELILNGLNQGSTYYYEVKSTNGSEEFTDNNNGNLYTFKTIDNVPPARVTGLTDEEKGTDYIQLSWDANDDSDLDHYLVYRNDAYIANVSSARFLDLRLKADTEYQYKIAAADKSGNIGPVSSVKLVRTNIIDNSPPIVSNVSIDALSENSATITWITDEDSNSNIDYGINRTLTKMAGKNESVKEHYVELMELENNTVYSYKAKSCDANMNCAESDTFSFKTGLDSEPPTIEIEIPEWYNSNKIDLNGKTESFARVRAYINDELKRAVTADYEGKFNFAGVSLDTNIPNKIKLVAIDQVGLQNFIEKEVKIDTLPPSLNVTKLGTYTNQDSITLEGYVDKEVNLEVLVNPESTGTGSLTQVAGLKLTKLEKNSIELEWDNQPDASGYIIYRNGKKLTTFSDTKFVDPAVNRSTSYKYEVSAYNNKCEEGMRSQPFTIASSADGQDIDDSFEEIKDYCQQDLGVRPTNVNGRFAENVKLNQGKNIIIVRATDKAGNSAEIRQETIVDSEKPEILETNLDLLEPSYTREVTITGKVSMKPGQIVLVTVYVNNDEKYTDVASEDGSFGVDIELEKKLVEELNKSNDYNFYERSSDYYSSYGEGYGTNWPNKIKIVAESESGLKSDPLEGQITLANCGYGGWWGLQLSDPSPSMLTPRLMLEGLAQIGIPITAIRWQGGGLNGTINSIQATTDLPLNDNDKKRYDLDWVQGAEFIPNDDYSKGYVLLTLRKLDSGSIFKDAEPVKDGEKNEDDLTTMEMEEYISEHRLNQEDCKVPGFGCIRVPVMLEIDFSNNFNENMSVLARNRREVEITKQKQCWDVEIAIDRRLPSYRLPEDFLRESVSMLNQTIEAINQIVKPINTIKEVLFYSCAASAIIDFAMAFQESYACEFSETLNVFVTATSGQKTDTWDTYTAQTGQCQSLQDDNQKQVCQQCSDAILARKNFESAMAWVCDRLFCPAAPSLQKYVKDASEQYGDLSTIKPGKNKPVASDCSFGKDYQSQLYYGDDYSGLKKLYADYKKQKEGGSAIEEMKVDCQGLHIPNKQCCGVEYMSKWDQACVIMDELKESKCLALEEQKGKGTVNMDPDCGAGRFLWNAMSGLCEPDGTIPAEIIPAHDTFQNPEVKEMISPGYADEKGKMIYVAGDTGNSVWFRFLKDDVYAGSSLQKSDASPTLKMAEIGYITTNMENAQDSFVPGQASKVASQRVFQPLTNQYGYFEIDTKSIDPNSKDYSEQARETFTENYMKATGNNNAGKVHEIYRGVQERLGVTNKDYIVDPTSGFLRSLQCVCLPGITSYLNLWKKVMEAIKICFETVLNTGDGNPGICKAVLSVYVCDLIYDLISCFTKKYGEGYRRTYEGGFGNFMGALTSAGTKVSNNIAGRYGETSIWKSLFAEKKLVHAVCLWAFTGTWDFDVSAVMEQDISVDVNSVAFTYPCERRYISFNPTSNPPGLTTYNYHIGMGMVAGSQLSYTVDLVCSDDYSCDNSGSMSAGGSSSGGQCDCVGIGKQTRHIVMGPGTAARGQSIEDEVYENLKDSPYRFDKVIIKWTSAEDMKSTSFLNKDVENKQNTLLKSGQQECKIEEKGGRPPAFCNLDVAEGKFQCDLGFNDENYIKFYNDPTPVDSVYDAEQNNRIKVNLRMSQRQPKRVDEYSGKEINPYTKFMQMVLYNQDGVLLKETEFFPFNGNGIHEMNDLPGFTFDITDFRRQSSRITATGPVSIEMNDRNPGVRCPNADIEIIDNNRWVASEKIAGTDKTKECGSGSIMNGNMIANDGYIIKFLTPVQKGIVIHITYESSPISSDICTSDIQHWKLKVTFYDKQPNTDEPSGQISTYQGIPVEKTVDIPVRCKKAQVYNGNLPLCVPNQMVLNRCLCGGTGTAGILCPPNDGGGVYYCTRSLSGSYQCEIGTAGMQTGSAATGNAQGQAQGSTPNPDWIPGQTSPTVAPTADAPKAS